MKTLILGAALALSALTAQALTATHQYRLDGSLADDLGGAALISHGGTLGASAYSFGANQGLEMAAGLGAEYTIDLSFHFDVQGGWRKIVDFSALASDAGMYRLDSAWDFYPTGLNVGAVAAGVDARLTLTRDAAGLVSVYGDGAPVLSFQDSAGQASFGGRAAFFFIDDLATHQGEAGAGQVDYIRTYARALNANEVSTLGPVGAVPEPASAVLALAGLAALLPRVRRLRRR